MGFAFYAIELLTYVFVLLMGVVLLVAGVLFAIDRRQTKDAIRRNYPVIGRFRHIFSELGEFFRQYFFAMDREEMPFNRAIRSWVYRASKQVDANIAFGSTDDIHKPGQVLFKNSVFPVGEDQAKPISEITFGPHCKQPYTTNSIFNISAMSYGALSKVAVEALSRGAKLAGCWINTGEGGISPYHLAGGGDLVAQIGTAKYGVCDTEGKLSKEKLENISSIDEVKMFEIKLSQGAKPGKGGILPGKKVTREISDIRGIPEGEASISPNGHKEFRCEDDILDMISFVREITGRPVGIKFVLGDISFVENLCECIRKRGVNSAPDFITVDSADGGTGAAPQSLFDYVGMPITESLPLVVDTLDDNHLRDRVKVIASGKLITPGKVAWALAVGADFVVSARGFMFALGCIQALQCNKNTCPTGITTHNESLQRGLVPEEKSHRVANYAKKIAYGVSLIAHSCGVSHARSLRRSHMRVIQNRCGSTNYAILHPEHPAE